MSCQKALLRTASNNIPITEKNNNNNVCDNYKINYQSEDPYVFSEAIPTTPPAFFNTQKSRTRLIEVNSSVSSVTNNAKTFSGVQSQSSVKKLTNVCIVRPQQQQPNPLHVNSSILEEIKPSIASSKATLSPTCTPPSVWQAPFVLDGLQSVPVINGCPLNTSINSTIQCHSNNGLDENGTNTISIPTTMAKVAFIVPVPPTNVHSTKLPPSKFHQNTMAQELQKVQNLKVPNIKCSSALPVQSSSPSLQYLVDAPVKHSKNNEDFNDIPGNVICHAATIPDYKMKTPLKCENTSLISCQLSSPICALNSARHSSSCLKAQSKESSSHGLTDELLCTTANNNNHNNITSSIKLLALNEGKNKVLPLQEKNQIVDVKINQNKDLTLLKTLTENENVNSGINILPLPEQKKPRKGTSNISYPNWQVSSTVKGAVAVIKMSPNEALSDISLMASASSLPYCLQHNWLNTYSIESLPLTAVTINREERIIKHKKQLRHKAQQLLSIKSLQKLPLQLAKKRLLCVKRLLYKYNQQKNNNGCVSLNPLRHCTVSGCNSWCIEMASYCQKHIVQNVTQQLFVPCAIRYINNDHCDASVFDVTQEFPLCVTHSHKRNELNDIFKEQQKFRRILPATVLMSQPHIKQSVHTSQQLTKKLLPKDNNSYFSTLLTESATTSLKRKLNFKEKPRKRTKNKLQQAPIKNCNKSVSQSSSTVHQHPLENLPTTLKTKSNGTSLESTTNNCHQSSCLSTSISDRKSNSGIEQKFPPFDSASLICRSDMYNNNIIIPSLNLVNCENKMQRNFEQSKTDDLINQFTFTNHLLEQQYQHQSARQINVISNTNLNLNCMSASMNSTASPLLSGDNIFTQDMLNISENTSAGSTDTGLGGFSDTELTLSDAADTDTDIQISDGQLLGEHVLNNVLSFLPEDTFKEIFATVQLDESDEIDRAIEIADKSLQTLQQTIGSGLNDFLDFNDDILTGPTEYINDTTSCLPNPADNIPFTMDDSRNDNVNNNNAHNGDSNLTESQG